MSGGPLSGRYSVISGIPAVRGWGINDNGSLARFVNSATAIGHGSRAGTTSWGGQYASHGAVPTVLPGVLFGFIGYTAPDSGILGGVGMKYSGNAMAQSATINWDWATGDVISHQVAFEGDLALTPSDGAYSQDLTVNDPEPVGLSRGIEYSVDGSAWTLLTNITQAQLTLQNAVQSYTNSSTAGGTGRRAGVVDANASITLQDTVLGQGLVKNSAYQFRFYTTATLFYLTKWMRVKEFTNLSPSQESGAIIQHNISLEMAGVENVAAVPTKGSILLPGGSAFW